MHRCRPPCSRRPPACHPTRRGGSGCCCRRWQTRC
ncbi:hypothetical protein EVA_20469 [gut metagenome]|uniref:Uncharacterized protein n=1 Tax=gut metagenome TaxID=749906 RepID=J9FVL2_9ZZZZ